MSSYDCLLSQPREKRNATQIGADFLHPRGTQLSHAPPQPLLRDRNRALCRLTAQGAFMPSSSFKTTSDGTPRIVEVIGATVTVDKYAMALLRVSTRAGRFLSGVLPGVANW